MTEAEWLSCTDNCLAMKDCRRRLQMSWLDRMRLVFGETESDHLSRKELLKKCACCQHLGQWMPQGQWRHAVEIIETALEREGGVSNSLLVNAQAIAGREISLLIQKADDVRTRAHSLRDFPDVVNEWKKREREISSYLCHLERELYGNPFRPVSLTRSWLTPTVLALATAIYADRAFDRMPILADALEEAGCDNADILTHCRGDGPHVRGCWVVDLILGKR